MRTIGFPMRLGIGVLAVTSLYAPGTSPSGGDCAATRELAIACGRGEVAASTIASPDASAAGSAAMRSGYMVISGRTVSH